MVRITSDGRVVDSTDNNPNREAPRSTSTSQNSQNNLENGFANVWNTVNERLNSFGIQSFNVVGYTIEPAHLLIFLIVFLFAPPFGLLIVIAAIVFSQRGTGGSNASSAPTSDSRRTNPFHAPPSAYRESNNSFNSKPSGPFSGQGRKLGE